jgi:hypothetical protein
VGLRWRRDVSAAFVASRIGAPLHFVEIMGDWAKNIAVNEGKYIDTTIMTLSPTP